MSNWKRTRRQQTLDMLAGDCLSVLSERSTKRAVQNCVLSSDSIMSFVTFKEAVKVLCCFLKPDLFGERILLAWR